MKKIFTLLCAIAVSLGMANAQSSKYEVTNKKEFTDALATIAGSAPGTVHYVYINGYVDVGTLKNGASEAMKNTLRNIHFVGVNDEESGERATLSMEMQMPADNTEADKFSMHFENLKLRQTQGVWGNSKHLMNFKDAKKHYIDTLEFINCELTELCRSLYRAEAQNKEADAGTMKVFRMLNCEMHNGFRQSSAMPAIYMAQPVNEMTFRNNTFYDLTYLNGLVSFGTMTENTGRQAVKVVFENNTVCAWSKSSLLGYAGGVSTESEFHIKNNIILQPNWIDLMNGRQNDTNNIHEVEGETWTDSKTNPPTTYEVRSLTEDELQARIEKGVVLTNLDGGLVQMENNLLYGYKYQNLDVAIESGAIIPIGDTEEDPAPQGDFTSLAMADVPFAWSDFVDAQNDKFQINNQNPAYTAGKNGAPIGDINNYTDQVIKAINVSAKVEGSNTVSVSVSPVKEKYFTGDQITITLNDHNTALRTINTFKGWNDDSKETTRVITLETEDIDLTATYESAVENIISAFDFAVTPSAGQNKLTSYAADVYATGNQAVAKMFYVPNIVENEVVTGVGETYQAADGTENRFNWRSGKFGEDATDQQVCVLSRKTAAAAQAAGKPDYIQFELSTTGLTGIEFSAFCGTDNYGYKTQLADYSLDGTTWTNFAKVDMESRAAEYSIGEGVLWGWTELKGTLPAAAENQAKVYIRVIGDTTGEKAENGVTEISDESNMFEYLASVLITSGNAVDGIKTVSSKKDAKAEAIYNLMGIKVKGNKSGLYIKGNKKFVK